MIGEPELLGDLPGIDLVRRHLLELLVFRRKFDSERMHHLLSIDAHQRADDRRIQSSAQEHSDGNVRPHLQTHRIRQQRIQFFHQRAFIGGPLRWMQTPILPHCQLAILQGHAVTRRQFQNVLKSCPRRNLEPRRCMQRVQVRPLGRQRGIQNRLDLRAKNQAAIFEVVVQRLDSQPVPRRKQLPLTHIINRERKHAV